MTLGLALVAPLVARACILMRRSMADFWAMLASTTAALSASTVPAAKTDAVPALPPHSASSEAYSCRRVTPAGSAALPRGGCGP